MQIIDKLEVNKRGPYGGGIGHVSFTGSMDMALGLRTMVIQTASDDTRYKYTRGSGSAQPSRREWVVHLQVGGAEKKMEGEHLLEQGCSRRDADKGKQVGLGEGAGSCAGKGVGLKRMQAKVQAWVCGKREGWRRRGCIGLGVQQGGSGVRS